MTTIPPSLPQVPATPVAAPAAVTATVVSQPPAQIANLLLNSVIEATVTAAPARGLVQIDTAAGPLTIRLPVTLPPNATLSLQLSSLPPNLQFRLLSINGMPTLPTALAGTPDPLLAALAETPEFGATGAAAGALPGSAQLSGAQPSGPATSPGAGAIAGGIPATVIYGGDPSLPPGTTLLLRIVDLQLPGASGPGPAGNVPRGPGVPGPYPAQEGPPVGVDRLPAGDGEPVPPDPLVGTRPEAPLPGGPPTPSGTPLGEPASDSPMLGAAPSPEQATTTQPGPPTPTPVAGPAPQPPIPATLSGIVAPNSLGGAPLVQTPAGLLSLGGGLDLPPGTQLELAQIGPPTLPEPGMSPAHPEMPASASATPTWPAIADAVATLQKADPSLAQMLLQRLPDLGPQFVPAAVVWISAVQSGDVKALLGESTIKALEKAGRKDIAERIGADLGDMRSAVSLPSGGDWQSLTLPLFLGQRVERIRLTVRRPPEDDEEAAGRDEEGLRFLVDLDMTRLGAMQIDGLVKRRAKRFDLIIRSRLALADEVRRDIGGIFNRALEGLGMTGSATFKQSAAFVEPIPVRPHAGLTI